MAPGNIPPSCRHPGHHPSSLDGIRGDPTSHSWSPTKTCRFHFSLPQHRQLCSWRLFPACATSSSRSPLRQEDTLCFSSQLGLSPSLSSIWFICWHQTVHSCRALAKPEWKSLSAWPTISSQCLQCLCGNNSAAVQGSAEELYCLYSPVQLSAVTDRASFVLSSSHWWSW